MTAIVFAGYDMVISWHNNFFYIILCYVAHFLKNLEITLFFLSLLGSKRSNILFVSSCFGVDWNKVNFCNFPGRSKNKNQGLYYLYLEAVSVRNSKSQSTEDVRVTNSESGAYMLFDFFSFSPRDLEFFVKFSEEHGSDIFRQIVHSFCPSIYGHELVKGMLIFIDDMCC